MGVYYRQYLVPERAGVRYRPDEATLAALVTRLQDLKWIDPAWRTVRTVGVGHESTAAPRSVAEDASVFRALDSPLVMGPFPSPPPRVFWGDHTTRADGLSRAYDFREDPEAILLPQYNDEVTLVSADVPCLVSTNAYSDAYPDQAACAQCGGELVVDVEELFADDPERTAWFGSAGVARVLPTPCRACGAPVALQELAELPLFSFAVVLAPPTKSTPARDEGAADPVLLDALRELTGVPFEMYPEYS
jgi:hypothetical protein